MTLTGYESVDAIATLQNEEERKKMFEFVVSLKDCVEDMNSTFGIFAKKPEIVNILPGLKPDFDRFIQAVLKCKATFQAPDGPVHSTPKSKPKGKQSATEPPKVAVSPPSLESLQTSMRKWLQKHNFNSKFMITHSTNEKSHTFTYACTSCGWKCHVTGNNNRVSLSNVHRHYSTLRCQKLREKKNPELSSSTIADYYHRENNQKAPINPNEVDFSSSATKDSDQTKPATVTQGPKNLLPPAGILENTEPSGH